MTAPATQLQRAESAGVGASQSPGPTLLGQLSLLPPQFRWTYKTAIWYPTAFSTLGASATQQSPIQIDSQSHFILCFAGCIVTDTTFLIQLAFIPQLVQIMDSAGQTNLFQSATGIHANLVYGDAQNPGIFAVPYIFAPGGTLTVQHQNQEAVARQVYISFSGFKSYPKTDTRKKAWQRQQQSDDQ